MPDAPSDPIEQAVRAALATVVDPEIRRPVTELGMIRSVTVTAGPDAAATAGAHVTVGLDLTVATCPMRDTLVRDVEAAVRAESLTAALDRLVELVDRHAAGRHDDDLALLGLEYDPHRAGDG